MWSTMGRVPIPLRKLPGHRPAWGGRFLPARKKNGGPGSARNHAVHRVGNPDMVLFLDSDDQWSVGHLANVREAAALGADLYFADHIRAGHAKTRFGETDFPGEDRAEHNGLREWTGDLPATVCPAGRHLTFSAPATRRSTWRVVWFSQRRSQPQSPSISRSFDRMLEMRRSSARYRTQAEALTVTLTSSGCLAD